MKYESKDKGYSVLESLYALLLASIVTAGAISGFLTISKFSNNSDLRVIAQLKAQSALDMITPDLRMIGNGVPFHQANFLIAQQTLTDNTVTQPIITSETDEHKITFRINETGDTYILMDELDPTLENTFTLTSVEGLNQNDTIYITNATVAEDDGLYGVISSINSGTKIITLQSGMQFHPGAKFPKGSLLEVVKTVSYSTDDEYSNLVRSSGEEELTLVENAIISFSYLNAAGGEITLPLVASSADPFPASAIQNVHAIKVKIQVQTDRKLAMGAESDFYVSEVYRTVGIRNLNYKY